MQYALLIYEKADYRETVAPENWKRMMEQHTRFWKRYSEAKLTGGAGLEGHRTATSLRKNGDNYQVTDGPFVETREVLGGFYIVECADLDEAMALAREIPVEEGEGVEVRPLMSE
jgi:hypothetical protein